MCKRAAAEYMSFTVLNWIKTLFTSLCVLTHSTVNQTHCQSTRWEVVVTCEMLNHFTVTALSSESWQRGATIPWHMLEGDSRSDASDFKSHMCFGTVRIA